MILEASQTRPGVECDLSTIWYALRAPKISSKKTLAAAAQQRPDFAAQRLEFETTQKIGIDPDRFVFLDETWVKTNMTRRYGWGPTGRRLRECVPHGHWLTTTFVCAMRSTGLIPPLVIDGAINGAIFRAWVEQELAPALRPGDIVVMDNLPSHKVKGVAEAIRAVDASVLYLPPYRPNRNPIENVSSKTKQEMRKRRPRTKADCDTLCGECLDWFSPAECRNYMRHAGYMTQE